MDNFYVVLTILTVIAPKEVFSETTLCPKYCSCDLYEKLNRADCSDKRLISPDIDVPVTVEILDLGYNDISSLENKCFEGLQYLINITLSNNAIHTIYLNAFIDLINLQHIDMAHNRLEYFDPRIFENNRKLLGVNLDGNKFMTLKDQPFIISSSIEFLSLHRSQIMQTTASQFSKLPALTKLDLSDNFMITLNISTYIVMEKLKYLNVLNNRWTTCDNNLKLTIQYLRKKNVETRINVCNFNTNPTERKFERMMMGPAPATTTEQTEKDIIYVWKNISNITNTRNVSCNEENLQTICYLYESCNLKYTKLIADQTIQNYRSRLIDQADPIYVALCSGLFMGFFITVSIVYVIYLICGSRYWKKRRLQKRIAERRRCMMPCEATIRSSVQIPRHLRSARNSTRIQPSRHAIHRANQREFLLARLFERPERRRNICNHTPSRLRRLNNNLDTERLIRASPPCELLSPITISLAAEDLPAAENEIQQTINVELLPRPETPPPAYNELKL